LYFIRYLLSTGTNEITNDQSRNYCEFNYDGYECDEGTITTIVYSYTGDPNPTDADPAVPECSGASIYPVASEIEAPCGGSRYNCIEGAVLEDFDPAIYSSEITENQNLEALTISKTYTEMYNDENYNSNMKLANFSRICSDTETTPKTSALNGFTSGIGILNGAQIEDIPFGYRRDVNNDVITADTLPKAQVDPIALNERTFLADNIFRGAATTKPYYAFYCLDQAFDVKAQIRLFIREWDREFTPGLSSYTTSSRLISDVGLATPLMDARFESQSGGNMWNDIADLDDFLERDTNDDQAYDSYIFDNGNECFESTTPFDSGNFPGAAF
jgi:hypothetical protein